MQLSIKLNKEYEGTVHPKTSMYDIYLDDYHLYHGVTGLSIEMNASKIPEVTIRCNPSKIDVEAEVIAKLMSMKE